MAATVWLVAACSPVPVAPLKVGMNAWVGFDTLVLARELDLIDPADVRVIELVSGSDTLRNLRNGLLDAGAVTLDEALSLSDEGVDVRIVAVFDESRGADMVLAEPRIQSLADLKGASIAVERTTVGALMLQRLLEAASLTLADVQVVNIEAPQHLTALRSDRVQAVVTYEPVAAELRKAGYQRLFDSARMPGDIQDVLVVRADVLQQRPEQVDALLLAWANGLKNLNADPAGAARILSTGLDMGADAYVEVLDQVRFLTPEESWQRLAGPQPPIGRDAQPLVEALMRVGRLQSPPDWARMIDVAPGQRLVDRMGAL